MTQFAFGTGNIYGAPVGGGAPIVFGSIMGATMDISGDVKMLYGQNQYPDDVAVGKRKITGKITVGRLDLAAMGQIYFNSTPSAGQTLEAVNESGTPTTTYTAVNAATWTADCGVSYQSTGVPLVQVTTTPLAGQYEVTAGVYTFASGDSGKAMFFNYTYTSSSTGSTLNVNQSLMGNISQFQLLLMNNFKGKTFGVKLFSCVSDKLNFPFKQDDYLEQEYDFAAYANTAGNVMQLYSG
jgi:hypothetical protein